MLKPFRGGSRNLTQSLAFLPAIIATAFAALGIGLVEIDSRIDLEGSSWVFSGDGPAARTVLSVIAGSLITVAGLTFSITIVVLQLASSQFSPRILRTFFGDRITQITIGTYVATFIYALLVLRAVGSFGEAGFVPRLSVTLATLLGIGAVALLIVFLHHVSQMIQVSHVTSTIGRATLARADAIYPDPYGDPATSEDGSELRKRWRSEAEPGLVEVARPGYVQRVALDDLAGLDGVERLAILHCPGDFVGAESVIAEIWPPAAAVSCRDQVARQITISDERDLAQDVDFGIRQLADTAIKAMSPGINDPMTAITCIGYMRSILIRITERADLASVRRFSDGELTIAVRRRSFTEHLEPALQINHYLGGDVWVAGELIDALEAVAQAARPHGSRERARAPHEIALVVARQAIGEARNDHDRERMRERLAALEVGADGPSIASGSGPPAQ